MSDAVRSRDFYVDALGLAVIRDDSSTPGMHWVEVAPKGATTGGVVFEQEPETRPYGIEAVLRDPDGNRLVLLQRTGQPGPAA
ncbi:hypothetical protein [Nonomuraea sp. KM90]|uniref:hypothetical protein n=1 Tax=Nonomuraea sp. KM90 TaxID=3457428 RepID=UPI003FCC8184